MLLIAGRNLPAAQAFAATLPNAAALVADRDAPLDAIFAEHRPALLIDCAGPFRSGGYAVPLACARARVPYLDLADGRAFVTGIGALDAVAKAGGVPIVAGASSLPALSGAVARHLADGLDRVDRIDMSISASNRATVGPSVAASILSQVGRPVALWRGRRWVRRTGWQDLVRETYAIDGEPPLRGRWVALADVPDHDLLVAHLSGRPAVTFSAGTELALPMLALRALSWPVRRGWMTLDEAARWLLPLQRLTAGLGTDRSAMSVRVVGQAGGRAVARHWTLLASRGHGPEIPTLAATLLAVQMLAGTVPPGAIDAGGLLTLADFEPLFAGLSIRHETFEPPVPPPLYARILGDAFDRLPPMLRAIHGFHGDGGAAGGALVERGRHPLARLVAALFRFPPAGDHDVHVGFRVDGGREVWTRDFCGRGFSSELSRSGARVVERFGFLRFAFDLPADALGLRMVLRGWSVAGVPLPLMLAPRIRATEWQEDEAFRFDVEIALPVIGRIVRYQGRLTPLD